MGGMASTSRSSTVPSFTFAAVGKLASGIPCRSPIRWCFVPGLARSVGLGPTCTARGALFHAFGGDRGAVGTGATPVNFPGRAQAIEERLVQALPHSGGRPVAHAPPAGHAT